jgi:hypothetical protein
MIYLLNSKGKITQSKEETCKPDLYELIKTHNSVHRTYSINSILAECGHFVIWLPTYHSEMNSIK